MASSDGGGPSKREDARLEDEYIPYGEPAGDQIAGVRDPTEANRHQPRDLPEDHVPHQARRDPRDRGRATDGQTTADEFGTSGFRAGAPARPRATAAERGELAAARDRAAAARDRAAQRRDDLADGRDDEIARLERTRGVNDRGRGSGELVVLRAAQQRRQATEDRRLAAAERAAAAAEREQAALDRRQALEDRERAEAELALAGIDELTGAIRRGIGLEGLEREIDRARRVQAPLVLAFVDVDGLKLVNDGQGHLAGDDLLVRVSRQLRLHLRPYDLVVRYGGDEFLCVVSDTRIHAVRRRLDEASAQLAAGPGGGTFSVGFAELHPGDSIQDLIQRADADGLYHRYRHRLQREEIGVSDLGLGRLFRRPSGETD